MTQITIRQVFRINNVATDVASFLLSNPGATAGVIRTDTGAVVVSAGEVMQRVATGTYEYAFTAPAAGLTYTAYYKITAADGSVYNLQDTLSDASNTDSVPMPELTGDTLQDTLNALEAERLKVARSGPKVSYSLHGHMVNWTAYLRNLDERILAIRKEIAQSNPWEEIGVGF